MVIRVSSDRFDQLVVDLTSVAARVEHKNIEALDVTEEYLDIQTRLKNKREVESRYRAILKQAKTIEEILKVEEHIRAVREEIESKEGRLKYLNDRIAYSTVNLSIYKYHNEIYRPSFFSRLADGFRGGWNGFGCSSGGIYLSITSK